MKNTLDEIVKRLFASEKATNILVSDMMKLNLEEWFYIDGIRYKFVEKTEDYIISITEWIEDDKEFPLHEHSDADETIFIIKGEIYDILNKLTRRTYDKLWYKKGVLHKLRGKKGTLITVKFDLK